MFIKKSLSKEDLARRIVEIRALEHKKKDISIQDVKGILDITFGTVIPEACVKEGKTIYLKPYGSFACKYREAYDGKHPKTREHIRIPRRHSIKFKTGEGWKFDE